MLKINELAWEEGRVTEDCIKCYNYRQDSNLLTTLWKKKN